MRIATTLTWLPMDAERAVGVKAFVESEMR
jgi:hypothetical protein